MGGEAVDLEHVERVEAGLDTMILRRHDRRVAEEGHVPSEELYEESCRRWTEARLREIQWEWFCYYDGQIRRQTATFELLIAGYRAERDRLGAMLGIETETNGTKEAA
jgi:hypothetical protein